MSGLHYQAADLFLENVSLKSIAEKFGTPTYVYSESILKNNWQSLHHALKAIPHQICYAVKANSNLAILHLFAKWQAGFDIVSIGELKRVLAAKGDAQKVFFSGVGKTTEEIEQAIQHRVFCFDIESEPELRRLQAIAQRLNVIVNIALRINPDVDPQTHAHISTGLGENKFGIDFEDIIPLCKNLSAFPQLKLIGIACHIGSQITTLAPFLRAWECLLKVYTDLQTLGITLTHINVGGGLGITYHQEQPPSIHDYAQALINTFKNCPAEIILEPGRILTANAGVLLTRVEYIKTSQHKNFIITDAGMNDLLRPALYDAWQGIIPVLKRNIEKQTYDIAGPVCESADFFGKARVLAVESGDLLVIENAGAYGFSMSSNYNTRCRPAEVLIDNNEVRLIRRREKIEELFAAENI